MQDSKLWGEAYLAYKRRYPLSTLSIPQKRKMKKKAKKFGKEVNVKASKDQYENTLLGYKWWRGTKSFEKWSRAQFMKQGGTCYYCDVPLHGIRENVEHVIPKSKGGTNSKKNLVLSCTDCNKKKYSSMISLKERERLEKHNTNKDRDGYFKFKEQYPTELEIAHMLQDMLREE